MQSPLRLPYDALAQKLSHRRIDTDKPNFLNDAEHIDYVGQDPQFIETYACFIQRRTYSDSYRKQSEKLIRIASQVLHQELITDGRLGACIDASGVLTQVLELLGVWSYQVVGALTVLFPPDSGIEPLYFYPYDVGKRQFAAAHSWIVAPPFAIVDVTISTQPYISGVNAFLPDVVLQPNVEIAEYTIEDVCSPSYVAAVRDAGHDKNELDKGIHTSLAEFHSAFPPSRVTHELTELKYIPNGITSMDGTLEETKAFILTVGTVSQSTMI